MQKTRPQTFQRSLKAARVTCLTAAVMPKAAPFSLSAVLSLIPKISEFNTSGAVQRLPPSRRVLARNSPTSTNSKFEFPFRPERHTMDENCPFCKICAKQIDSELLYEDEEMVVFKDIKPAAKHHYLAVPKEHIITAKELKLENKTLVENMIEIGKKVLSENGGDVNDVRLGFHWPPFNSIAHLHMHIISPASEMSFLKKQIFRPDTFWFVSPDYVMQELCTKL